MNKVQKAVKKIKAGFLREAFGQIRWIYSLAGEHKKGILLYAAISMVSMLISMFFNVQIKGVIDYLVAQDWHKLWQLLILYVTVGMVNVFLSMLSQRLSAVIHTRVRTSLCAKVYHNLLAAKWEKLSELDTGDMLTRIQEDAVLVAGSTVGWVPTVVIKSCQVLLSLAVIVYYDASMLLVIIVLAPIMLIGSRIFLGKTYESNKKQRIAASSLMSLYKETFQNIQTLKAFGLQEYFCRKEASAQQDKAYSDLEVNQYSLLSWMVMYISGQLVALVCLAWTVYHIYTGVITLGTMALILVMAGSISSNFKSLIQMIPTAMGTVTAAERVQAMLHLEPEEMTQDIAGLEQKAHEYGMGVSVEALSFSYKNGKKVFENVSFEVQQGETIALVGASGEGKTTMLRLLLSILSAQSGGAYLTTGGEKVELSPATRRLIAYVPQGNTMLHGTLRENLTLLRQDVSDEEVVEALKKACAYEFVSRLPDQLDYMVGEAGTGFSEGQNQRLAIARALLCEAPVLLLDEATSALDVATERRLLRNLMTEGAYKRTCILTTHRPSVLSICDNVYRVADCKLEKLSQTEIEQLAKEF